MITGDVDRSVEQVRIGREANPSSLLANSFVMFHTLVTRRYDEAIAEGRSTLARFGVSRTC